MENNIDYLFDRMLDKNEQEAYKYAEILAKTANSGVFERAVDLLRGEDMDAAYLAAQALGKREISANALAPLLDAIHDWNTRHKNCVLVASLDAFDLRENFVDVLRIYLFGNFKASSLARDYLDHTDFHI